MQFVLLFILSIIAILNSPAAQVSAQGQSSVVASATSAVATSAVATSAGPIATAVSGSQAPPAVSGSGILTAAPPQGTAAVSGSGVDASLAGLPTSGTFGNTVYPGAATFLQPTGTKSVSPLFRINSKENVTFQWSFTNMLIQPQTLSLAAVAPNKVTYPITALNGAATSAVWHLSDVPAASPLMMGLYTIQLYDQRGISAFPQPGWLSPVTSLKIALYSAESYSAGATGTGYCPYCFYSSGRKLAESFGPIALAFGVAGITSVLMLYGLFN